MKFITSSLEATRTLGEKMGKRLRGDETIALVGDLGAGKTAFTQGLAKGLGVKNAVTSPTFVLEKIYQGSRGRVVHHFDAYRVEEKEIDDTGLPEILGEEIVIVEWADKIKNVLPIDTIWIKIRPRSNTQREFVFDLPDARSYILELT